MAGSRRSSDWLWQSSRCADAAGDIASCARRTFFSIRLPVEAYREALFGNKRPAWPPADLDRTLVHLQMLAPDRTVPVFDSNAPGATIPLALSDLAQALLPGEALVIRKTDGREAAAVARQPSRGNAARACSSPAPT